MYVSKVLGATSTTNIRGLQVFQNKQLMHVVNAPWYIRRKDIHDDLKIDPISEFIKKTSLRFFDKLPQIRNELLLKPTYDPAIPSSRKLRWMLSLIISLPSKDEGLIRSYQSGCLNFSKFLFDL
ncbi:hypothetical protein AVEN_44369-1 [Araneus ventricosus]|uniref:Uncharacterized protein n=1 Tax=Araneus ventricosus TaxID=182803 RepID=A0A4Y2IZH6_ARAVE|nr:hypothetical protein AVEN_44369-1 [Araneus ventricosus]